MPDPAFDSAAHSYDIDFTESEVGKLQRSLVYDFLTQKVLNGAQLRVLELNCGTGADAIWMAEKGADVLATDLSGEMVAIGKRKWQTRKAEMALKTGGQASGILQFSQMDLRSALELDEQFDLIFSNFGGLNCISPDEMKNFFQQIPKLLRNKGQFVGVVMPRSCIWESLYYMAKFRFKEAFRRSRTGPIAAPLGNNTFQDTWYYNPRQIRNLVPSSNSKTEIRPIGFFLPPSYLDPFFQKRPKWLQRLNKWEQSIRHKASLASRADHFLIAVTFFH